MPTTRFIKTRPFLVAGLVALLFSPLPLAAHEDSNSAQGAIDNAASNEGMKAATAGNPNAAGLSLGDTGSASDPLSSFGSPSGTVVSSRAAELREEVVRLRTSVNLNSNQFGVLHAGDAAGSVQYHSTIAAITARLQNGTTRGNPILMRQWDEANVSLGDVSVSLGRLNALLIAIDNDSSVAAYLAQSVRAAFELAGALDEDHDQLKLLLDEINRQMVQLDFLRSQTMSDIRRQNNYLSTERANLQSLAFSISRGELIDSSTRTGAPTPVTSYAPPTNSAQIGPMDLQPQVHASPSIPVSSPSPIGAVSPQNFQKYMADTATQSSGTPIQNIPTPSSQPQPDGVSNIGRLVVLIRYNQPVVDYQQQLSQAIGKAVERHPNAEFSIVAVSPALGDPSDLARTEETAKKNAEDVKRSLVQLGLSPSNISMANTQMQSAQVPEVHVYMR